MLASICVLKEVPTATPVTIGCVEMPRRNIELKARDPDPDRSLQVSLEIGASDKGWLYQTDTYFRVPHGRLKLREEGAIAQLISYERANETVARESRYRLVPVGDPAGLKDALSDALGVLVVVEKSRRLLLWQGVRIHLDEVRGLGSFIEIEVVGLCPSRRARATAGGAVRLGAEDRTDPRPPTAPYPRRSRPVPASVPAAQERSPRSMRAP